MTTLNLGRVVGQDGEDGRGIVSIEKTATAGLVDTYTITYTDGTTSTYTVTNGSSGGGGTANYNELENKPSINNVSLQGNKTLSSLGIQEELVSGTNIKTINNNSILGSGNIVIEGSGGDFPSAAKTLLITILRAGVYTSDQSDNIDDLEDILTGGSQEVRFTQSGTTLIGSNIPTITTITKSGTTLVCE